LRSSKAKNCQRKRSCIVRLPLEKEKSEGYKIINSMTRVAAFLISFFVVYAGAAQAVCLHNDRKGHPFEARGGDQHATSHDSGSHDHSDGDVHCPDLRFQSGAISGTSLGASFPFAGNLRVPKSLGTIWHSEVTAADLWLRSVFWRALSLHPSIGLSRHILLSVLLI